VYKSSYLLTYLLNGSESSDGNARRECLVQTYTWPDMAHFAYPTRDVHMVPMRKVKWP